MKFGDDPLSLIYKARSGMLKLLLGSVLFKKKFAFFTGEEIFVRPKIDWKNSFLYYIFCNMWSLMYDKIWIFPALKVQLSLRRKMGFSTGSSVCFCTNWWQQLWIPRWQTELGSLFGCFCKNNSFSSTNLFLFLNRYSVFPKVFLYLIRNTTSQGKK